MISKSNTNYANLSSRVHQTPTFVLLLSASGREALDSPAQTPPSPLIQELSANYLPNSCPEENRAVCGRCYCTQWVFSRKSVNDTERTLPTHIRRRRLGLAKEFRSVRVPTHRWVWMYVSKQKVFCEVVVFRRGEGEVLTMRMQWARNCVLSHVDVRGKVVQLFHHPCWVCYARARWSCLFALRSVWCPPPTPCGSHPPT